MAAPFNSPKAGLSATRACRFRDLGQVRCLTAPVYANFRYFKAMTKIREQHDNQSLSQSILPIKFVIQRRSVYAGFHAEKRCVFSTVCFERMR
jgi:hypothetical protein